MHVLGSYLYIWETRRVQPGRGARRAVAGAAGSRHEQHRPTVETSRRARRSVGTGCSRLSTMVSSTRRLGQLNTVTVQDDRGTLSGWTVTGQLDRTSTTRAHGPPVDNVIPADFLTWNPGVALATAARSRDNANISRVVRTRTPAPTGFLACTGPSGTPAGRGRWYRGEWDRTPNGTGA